MTMYNVSSHSSRNASRVTADHGVKFVDLDMTSDESVTTVAQQVIERYGRIDVLVNNTGVGSAGADEESVRITEYMQALLDSPATGCRSNYLFGIGGEERATGLR